MKNDNARLAGVIGWPIDHSLSPKLHNFIANEMKHNLYYAAMPVKKEDIKEAFEGVRALGIIGINATAPHKYAALKLVDEVSDEALMCGSVNTIVNKDGILTGYSTDGPGLAMAMKRSGIEIADKNVLVLGAGGVASPVCVMLSIEHAASVTVINRTPAHAQSLQEFVKASCGYNIKIESEYNRYYDIVINCTSLGMPHNPDSCPIDDFSHINSNTTVIDLIYNPSVTKLLKRAKENGAVVMNGLGMLAFQGIIAYEKFMNCTLPENMGERVIRMLEKEI